MKITIVHHSHRLWHNYHQQSNSIYCNRRYVIRFSTKKDAFCSLDFSTLLTLFAFAVALKHRFIWFTHTWKKRKTHTRLKTIRIIGGTVWKLIVVYVVVLWSNQILSFPFLCPFYMYMSYQCYIRNDTLFPLPLPQYN